MLKKWTAVLLGLLVVTSFSAGCARNTTTQTDDKLKVSVSFDAMKEFVAAVGKDKVDVSTIIPTGVEPHDFEPKAQDLAALSTAQIFVYNGLGMEGWAEDAISAANNEKLVVVDASKGADVITKDAEEDEHAEHAEDAEDAEEGHSHGKYDPHLWLSLKGAQVEAKNIRDALVSVDPENKAFYEKNCDEFVTALEGLYNEYSGKFQATTKKDFVTGHAAFAYLCRDFGLEQNSVRDTFADGEPTAQQLAQLVEYCRENQVTTIFAEEMASPEVSETLANEVGAKVETIYTIESPDGELTYLERMESNLSKIYASLTK
ncbi:MAG: metal ABC transporter substrate-binding protein [Candidatus Merdivicinus sp.]|jgi:zinc transport system substrate-binding protein